MLEYSKVDDFISQVFEGKIGVFNADWNVIHFHMFLGYMAFVEFVGHSGDIPGMAVSKTVGNSFSPWT